MAKRKPSRLFLDLMAGFQALADERAGKIKLKRTVVKLPDPIHLSLSQFKALRKRIGMCRLRLAQYLRVAERTVLRWEQGRSSPSGPAAVLILLLARYPDMRERLLDLP